ncbi:hypothetical protein CEXT_433741 [Caerostris extrusa]|uniref:Uncharacterized protein n=1 Tax=Caerostris extrusa TaxID=172846 RepID=A0AAV4TJ22_CAEEX|nr:hypothetical protein CEXT_433741 [Caerostris extrusa]
MCVRNVPSGGSISPLLVLIMNRLVRFSFFSLLLVGIPKELLFKGPKVSGGNPQLVTHDKAYQKYRRASCGTHSFNPTANIA